MTGNIALRAFRTVILPIALITMPLFSFSDELPTVRVGVLKFGTINWEMDVIKRHQLDQKAGVSLEVVPLASKNASSVALQGNAVDIILSDWVWVSRQRASGKTYTISPTSATAGGIYAASDIPMKSPCDVAGKKLGIAGGSVDKTGCFTRPIAGLRIKRMSGKLPNNSLLHLRFSIN